MCDRKFIIRDMLKGSIDQIDKNKQEQEMLKKHGVMKRKAIDEVTGQLHEEVERTERNLIKIRDDGTDIKEKIKQIENEAH